MDKLAVVEKQFEYKGHDCIWYVYERSCFDFIFQLGKAIFHDSITGCIYTSLWIVEIWAITAVIDY